MAKIVLTISADNKATQSVKLLNAEVQTLSKTLSSITVNKDLTTQINALTKHYKAVADAHAKIIASTAKEKIEFQKLQQEITKTSTSGLKYEKELAKLNNELAKEKLTLEKTNTEISKQNNLNARTEKTTHSLAQAKEKDAQATQKQTVATKANTIVNNDNRQSIGSMTVNIFKWQLAMTSVMKPLRLLTSAWASLGETLVKTEDAVIAIQRVLGENIADNEISSRLYKIAQAYGQTFENVQQIATNFARTGMSWADTIKATEAAVLALNVAELDATEASDGLISILTQFKKETSDLTVVVDKLNKAADNNPVTTEKLLKALQRTGAAAQQANINLDETIGIITTLSKATNRSGENLGTALNSLIQFSSKSSSLDTFAKFGGSVETAVEKFRAGAGSILEIWQELGKVIQDRKGNAEGILGGIFSDEEWDGLNEELKDALGEAYADVTNIYDTASTFRKNYFIALLNDLDNVKKVTSEIADANGYSQEENKKYLDTYTAKVNKLNAQWQEIANSEQGLLGLKKGLVDLASGILSVTQSVGGLRTVFIALGSVLVSTLGSKVLAPIITNLAKLVTAFKNGSISVKGLFSSFGNAINPIKKFQSAMQAARKATEAQNAAANAQKDLTAALNNTNSTATDILRAETAAKQAESTATQAATTATKAWGSAIQTALGWIGLIITAASIFVGVLQSQAEKDRQAAEEAQRRREETIAAWEAIKNEAVAFAKLNKQYNDLKDISNKTTEQEKEFLSVQEQIIETLGYKAIALKKLTEGTEEYNQKLEELTNAEIESYAKQAQAAANAARKSYFHTMYDDFFAKKLIVQAYASASGFDLDENNLVDSLDDVLTYLYNNGQKESSAYDKTYEYYEQLKEAYETRLTTEAQSRVYNYKLANGSIPQTQNEIDALVDSIVEATGASERWRDTIEGVVAELIGFKTPQEETGKWANDISKVVSKYDDLIKKLEELRDLNKEAYDWEKKKEEVIKAEQALLSAQNEATVRRFNEASNQWEWQTDEKAIKEAEENLEKARQNLEEDAYNNIIKQLEEQTATNDSILAILKEVAPLLGEDFANAVKKAIQEKTNVDLDSPIDESPTSNGGTNSTDKTYTIPSGIGRTTQAEKDAILNALKNNDYETFKKYMPSAWDEERKRSAFTTSGGVFDNGGIANGLGLMPKATSEPETVNNPELTAKILSPVSNAQFDKYVRDMGIMFETAQRYSHSPIVERVSGAADNRVDNSGQITMNGVTIGSDRRGNSLDELLTLANIIPSA